MGGAIVDPGDCVLEEHSFFGHNLRLILVNQATSLKFTLGVSLRDGSFAVDLTLGIDNQGAERRRVMAAFPYLTGLGLGKDRSRNKGVLLYNIGRGDASAWEQYGGIYPTCWNMQWNAVYDPEARRVGRDCN